MAEKENSRYCEALLVFNAMVLVVPASFPFASFNPFIPVLRTLYNNTYYERNKESIPNSTMEILLSLTLSFPIITALLGSLATKRILLSLGPKKTQIAVHIYSIISNIGIMAIMGGLTGSYEAIIVGRLIMGSYLAVSINVGTVLVAEMCCKGRQPFYQSLLGVGLALGTLFGPVLGYKKVFGTLQLWPVLVSMTSLLNIIWLCLSPFIVDSPYYLLRVGRREDAFKALRKLRKGTEAQILEEISEIEKEQSDAGGVEEKDENASVAPLSLCEMFKTKYHRRILLAVFLIFSNMMLVGVNNVMFYSDQILLKAGIDADYVTLATIGIFTGEFFMAVFGSKLVDRFGAKKVSVGASVVMAIAHIMVTTSLATIDVAPSMRYLSVVGLIVFMLAWSGGPNMTTYPLVNSVTTTETRPTCVTYGSTVLWFAAFVVAFVPPYIEKYVGPYIMLPWFVFTILIMLYMVFCLPDMHKKTSEEIQEYMRR